MTDQGGWTPPANPPPPGPQPYPQQPYPTQPYPGQPYPGQGYPGQGYLPPGPPGWPQPARGPVNGFAVAALVLGILPGALLAIAFGIVALTQIGRRHQRGQARAIVGIVLGSLWTIIIVLAIIGATTDLGNDSGRNGDPSALKPGDCTAYVSDTRLIVDLPAVPCDGPHRNEVFASLDLGGGDWPGADALDTRAQQLCGARLDTIAETATVPDNSTVIDLIPTEIGWRTGDHTATCLLELSRDRSGRLLPGS